MLSLAYKKFPQSQCFPELLQTLVLIYFASEEGNFNPSEVRYLPNLKNDVMPNSTVLLRVLDK